MAARWGWCQIPQQGDRAQDHPPLPTVPTRPRDPDRETHTHNTTMPLEKPLLVTQQTPLIQRAKPLIRKNLPPTCQISAGCGSTFHDSSAPAFPMTRCTGADASTYTALPLLRTRPLAPLLLLPLLPPLPSPFFVLLLRLLLLTAVEGVGGLMHLPAMTGQVRW